MTENYLVRDLSARGLERLFGSFVKGNYHPLTMLSLALDYHFWGLRPLGYHLTSVVLHLLTTLGVFCLVRLLAGSRALATFVALFFGIHPLHVESVAWISGRKDVLFAAFYVAAGCTYLLWLRTARASLYVGTLVLFGLSLLAKATAVTFPVALLLFDFGLRRRTAAARAVVEKLPFFALALAFGIVAVAAQKAGGALQGAPPYSSLERLLVACRNLDLYLLRSVLPVGLSALYPYPPGGALPASWLAAPFLAGALAVAAYVLGRRSRGVLVGAGFFLVNIALVLQLFPVGGAIMADRYAYLPYVGVALALGESWRMAAGPFRSGAARALGAGLLALALVALVGATRSRCQVWGSSDRLWSDVLRHYPEAGIAYRSRAEAESETGRLDESADDLERALALDPGDAAALADRGGLRLASGQYERALADLDLSIRLDGRSAAAHNSRGAAYLRLGRLAQALADFDTALRLNDALPGAYANRGSVLYRLRQLPRALADYDRYLALDPGSALVHYWRGLVWAEVGDPVRAVADFDAAIRLDPSLAYAYRERARAHAARGELAAARRDAERARALGCVVDERALAAPPRKVP